MSPDAYQLAGFFLAQQQANEDVDKLVALAKKLVELQKEGRYEEAEHVIVAIAFWLESAHTPERNHDRLPPRPPDQ